MVLTPGVRQWFEANSAATSLQAFTVPIASFNEACRSFDALARAVRESFNPPLHKLRQRVRRGDLAPMEALSILTTERNAGRDPSRKTWAWVEQRIARATRKGGYGEAWIRRGGAR